MIDSFAPVNPALIDVFPSEHDGYPDALAGEDTPDVLTEVCGAASRDFPEALRIEPRDWADKARDNDKHKTHPINYVDRYTNQSPSHECTCHSLTRAMEGCWNRQRGIIYPDGPKKGFRYPKSAESHSVWFSALSVYAEANPRIRGGANVRQVMEIAVRRGILPDKTQPRDYGFKHDLIGTAGRGNSNQSSGSWVPLNRFPEGWKETAKHFRPLEVVFPRSYEEAVCLVLHGYLVGVGRDGHAIPWAFPTFNDRGAFTGMGYPDSYDVTRYDSASTVRNAWRGSFAILSMTMPDDWDNPAE